MGILANLAQHHFGVDFDAPKRALTTLASRERTKRMLEWKNSDRRSRSRLNSFMAEAPFVNGACKPATIMSGNSHFQDFSGSLRSVEVYFRVLSVSGC